MFILTNVLYLQENFSHIFSYLLAIKIGNEPSLSYDELKSLIEMYVDQNHFNNLLRSQFSDILLNCIQMVVTNTEKPIIPFEFSSEQFLNIVNIFQVKTRFILLSLDSLLANY